jgi:DNA-binding transcriptional ArsR family regulator
MNATKADLITHPLRARILAALMGRQLTTGQIAALLPDIPQPSLYRHIKTLLEGGAVQVVEEVRVNGALTKVYATVSGMTRLRPQDVQDAGKAEHLQYFTTFLNTLAQTFQTSLEHDDTEGITALISATVLPLHLYPEEVAEFQRQSFRGRWGSFCVPGRRGHPPRSGSGCC